MEPLKYNTGTSGAQIPVFFGNFLSYFLLLTAFFMIHCALFLM